MKISTLFIIILVIQLSFIIFDARTVEDTPIFGFIKNPTNWSSSLLITIIAGIAALAAISGTWVGGLIIGKTDVVIFGGFVAVMILWMTPIASFWNLLYEEVGLFGDANWIVASILTLPLCVYAIFTTLNWWRTTGEG